MKKIFILLVTINLCLFTNAQEQNLPEVIPPSPTVAALMKFEEVPVSYYTGQPNISIPLYNKSLNGGLSVAVTLNYNTQGIQIESRSGWTGTGWSLFAGGSISRTIRDLPDEAVKGSPGFSNKTGILHNDDYWNYENLSNQNEFNWKAVGSSVDKYDINLDLYQFNFLNSSGRFVIVKEAGVLVPKLITKNSRFKIELNYNPTTFAINSFTVIDSKGYKYLFDVVESSTSTSFSATMPQGTINGSNATETSFTVNSAWQLSKVYTSNDLELVSFNYAPIPEAYATSRVFTTNNITTTNSNLPEMLQNTYNTSIMEPKTIVSSVSNSTGTKKLSSIVFKDGTSVVLNTQGGHPEYYSGGVSLSEVIIKDENNVENKRFALTYDAISAGRLWLTKVSEIAGGITQDTELSYYNKAALPTFGSISDSWGYNSGIGMVSTGCSTSNFDDQLITTGLLTKIKYPTGGVKEFTFEHNAYSYMGNQTISYEEYMNNPLNINRTVVINNFNHSNLSSTSPILTNNIVLGFEQDVYILINLSSSQQMNMYRIVLTDNNGYERWVELDETCFLIKDVPAGTYSFGLKLISGLSLDPFSAVGFTRLYYGAATTTIREEMIGGGVRIKSVVFKDDEFSQQEARKINYSYDDENTITKSSGVVDAEADRLERRYSLATTRYLFNGAINNPGSFLSTPINYDVIEKGVTAQLSQGSYVGYRNVRVSESNNGYNLYRFTSAYDYPSPSTTFNLPNSNPAPNNDYKRGLLLKQLTYDNSNKILKEVENTIYDFQEDYMFKTRAVYKPKTCIWMQMYSSWAFYTNSLGENVPLNEYGQPFIFTYYNCGGPPIVHLSTDFNSGWAKLKETVTKEYFYDAQGTQSVSESKNNLTYNNLNYQVSQQDLHFNEAGVEQHLQNKSFYPVGGNLGSNTTTIRNKLIALNKVAEVLETQSFKNGTKLNETHFVYDEVLTDVILPTEIKVAKGSNVPETRIEYLKYDSYGNPLEVSKTDGTHIVYIWGYDNQFPIAKIENTTYATIEGLAAFGSGFSITDGLSNAQETALRGLANTMVTTYTYDRLIGVTSITDPKGYTMTYTYDAFNRLEFVKDADGNIISNNNYNYKQ